MRGKTELSASLPMLQKGHEKQEICLPLCALIHSSLRNSLLQGCTKAKPRGRHDWHLLILKDTKKHVITMKYTPSSKIRAENPEQQRTKNSEQNSKNRKFEFLTVVF